MFASTKVRSLERVSRSRRGTRLSQLLTTALLAVALGAPFIPSDSGRADSSIYAHSSDRPLDKRFVCGYDPQGATDALSNHKLNVLKLSKRGDGANFAPRMTAAGISVDDAEDIALVEDDGTIVISPTKFNFKNSSILFTPDGDGYRISSGGVAFTRDFGYRLGYFFEADDRLGDGDNGYRDVTLLGAQFPFFGVFYDTIFIGTNGYITFTKGDATARISPTTLGSTLPRIAPLWADLEVVDSGNIYYNRLEGLHLITWEGAGQPSYSGISTFQAALYDDGQIAFAYRKVKAQAALVGISPGGSAAEPQPVDFSSPPAEKVSGPFFEVFGKQKQYLMGLRSADEVGEIPYLVTGAQLTEFLREKSPFSGFSMSAVRKTTSVAQIVEREGPRIPEAANAQKEFRVAFILLTEQGSTPSSATLEKTSRYRDSLVRYFSAATGGRGSMTASLKE